MATKATITRIFGAMTQSNGHIQVSAQFQRAGGETSFMGTTLGSKDLANIVVADLDPAFEEAFLLKDPNDDTRWIANDAAKSLSQEVTFSKCTPHDEKDGVYWAEF